MKLMKYLSEDGFIVMLEGSLGINLSTQGFQNESNFSYYDNTENRVMITFKSLTPNFSLV